MNFLERDVVDAIHDRQIADHGGLSGVRDEGLLESALARPRNAFAYGETDPFLLAASLCFGIARNHPFLDANKRTAWVTTRVFLRLNDVAPTPDRAQAVDIMVAIAQGAITEADFGQWLRQQTGTAAAGSD